MPPLGGVGIPLLGGCGIPPDGEGIPPEGDGGGGIPLGCPCPPDGGCGMPLGGEGMPPEGDGGGGIPLGCPLEGGRCGGVVQAASENAAVTSSPITEIFLNRIAHLLTSPRGGHADRPRVSILI